MFGISVAQDTSSKCNDPICTAVECPFGTTSQPTILPNGCRGCPKCVNCVPKRCPAIACINSRPTVLPNGCPGCPDCNGSLND